MVSTNFKKIVFSAGFALISLAFVSPEGDKVRWNSTEKDFGDLKAGQVVETEFICYNGDDTLVIENVQTSCGCTVPRWKKTPVMPHDSTVIKVSFDTDGKRGRHEKVVAVYTNQGLYELVIKANILKK